MASMAGLLSRRKRAERQDCSVVTFLLQLSGGDAQPAGYRKSITSSTVGLALRAARSALTSDFLTWQTSGPHGVETALSSRLQSSLWDSRGPKKQCMAQPKEWHQLWPWHIRAHAHMCVTCVCVRVCCSVLICLKWAPNAPGAGWVHSS